MVTLIGRFTRSLLNINTVWGIMILAAFGLCLWQHYAATVTILPADLLTDGDNTVTIRVHERKRELREFDCVLTLYAGQLNINSEDGQPSRARPWLISTAREDGAFLLKWDYASYGPYEVAIGQQIVAAGKLVTLQALTDAAFDYAEKGFKIALGLIAAMVLFLGLMKVGEDAGIVQLVAKAVYPVIRFLFPDIPRDHPASGAILMNWTTTLLGLGNAATPFGLKAMKELESLNPHPGVASDSQVMLLGYNTAGLALLPTTLIAVRKSAGCIDPFEIIGPCMFAGLAATVTAIIMAKLLGKLPMFSVKAAVAEQPNATATDSGEGQ